MEGVALLETLSKATFEVILIYLIVTLQTQNTALLKTIIEICQQRVNDVLTITREDRKAKEP